MEDHQIVQLYWDRDEAAIPATEAKYGAYCRAIAGNILSDRRDAEECVNETWLNTWNAIPPHRPRILATFLGKITRNLSFNRYKHNRAAKRGGGQTEAVLDELAECVSGAPGAESPEHALDARELAAEIDAFLRGLPEEKRIMFLSRYWYADRVGDIAARMGTSEHRVSVILSRLRANLKGYLSERGWEV